MSAYATPPFHASQEEAFKGSQRKLNNLARHRGEQKPPLPLLILADLEAELWCKGGERLFLKKLHTREPGFFNSMPLVYKPGFEN